MKKLIEPWHRRLPWLKAVGGVILFGSWIFQNYFEAKWQDELAYLNAAQTQISVEEGHFTTWFVALYKEQRLSPPNDDVIHASALKAAQHQLNILTWATARVTDPSTHSQLLADKVALSSRLEEAHRSGDTAQLVSYLGRKGTGHLSRRKRLISLDLGFYSSHG